MARPAPGMGRGLHAIISAAGEAQAAGDELRELPVELIAVNPDQPRRRFDEQALARLAQSVSERGVLQPLLVRPRPGGTYELVAGERRLRAAQLVGLETVPALVRRGEQDARTLELALIENMAREDLTPIEEARACVVLVEELGLTHEQVAGRVGRSRAAVSNLVRLLELPEQALELIERGELSEGHGRALLLADDHAARRSLARGAAAEHWSVRTTEARARDSNASHAHDLAAPSRIRASASGAEQQHAAARAADALSSALGGVDVRVRPRRAGGLRAELSFQSAHEVMELARRLKSAGQVSQASAPDAGGAPAFRSVSALRSKR